MKIIVFWDAMPCSWIGSFGRKTAASIFEVQKWKIPEDGTLSLIAKAGIQISLFTWYVSVRAWIIVMDMCIILAINQHE
jgi:hypothetical protein